MEVFLWEFLTVTMFSRYHDDDPVPIACHVAPLTFIDCSEKITDGLFKIIKQDSIQEVKFRIQGVIFWFVPQLLAFHQSEASKSVGL